MKIIHVVITKECFVSEKQVAALSAIKHLDEVHSVYQDELREELIQVAEEEGNFKVSFPDLFEEPDDESSSS